MNAIDCHDQVERRGPGQCVMSALCVFGNIFVSPPKAYYCNGKDFAAGVVPGRIGANQVGAPYKNPFAGWASLLCKDTCTAADIPHQADGYKACFGFNNIVTVFRQ